MHDTIFCRAQEIGRASETVEHSRSHDAGRVCVGVDVYFDGRVHPDDAEATDYFG